jgi:poly-gamma-glutamate capsule biosynthesis protein CapA/YwtB (metallophosphatase superfamily)
VVRNGRDTAGDDATGGRRSLAMRSQRVAAVLALVVCVLAVGALGAAVAGTDKHGVKRRPGRVRRPESPTSAAWRGNGHRVVLAFGGDVHFEGALGVRLADSPASALDGAVSTLVSGANVSMVNFESALTYGGCPDPQPKAYVFHAPPSALTAFKAAHVSLVTEANNHGEDCGLAGLRQSLAIARAAHYPVIGIGDNAAQAFRPYRPVVDGQRIAIFAATQVLDADLASAWTATADQPGLASAYQQSELVAAVRAARRNSDTIVVYLHWGTETQQCPNALQEPLAAALVKAGADIVVGAHAHVQLGAGYLGTSLVDYGLGNFAFYDTTAPETDSGTLLVTATGRHIDHYQWRPAMIESGLPEPLHGTDAAAAVERWNGLRACTNLSSRPHPTVSAGA